MAFNPFISFRKYQKIWMAIILLLCMLTFVLCTGTQQGDLGDWISRALGRKGEVYFTVDNRSVYTSEAHNLRDRRNMVNEYMRTAAKFAVSRLDEYLSPENLKKMQDKGEEAQKHLRALDERRRDLNLRLLRPRFFEDSGVKADDLLNYKVWLAEADRLNVDLTPEMTKDLVKAQLTGLFYEQAHRAGLLEARSRFPRANEGAMFDALRDEFRVQLAQRALGAAPGGVRAAVTPGQMWEFYKEKRIQYRLSLMPMNAEDFTGKLEEPTDADLNYLFDKNRSIQYDPASPDYGFAQPSRAKIAWVSMDAKSKEFRKASEAVIALETAPLPNPQMAVWQVLGAQAAKSAAAANIFERQRFPYRIASLTEPGAPLSMAKVLADHDAASIAAFVAAGARRLDAPFATVPGGLAVEILRKKDKFDHALDQLNKKRLPIYATMPGLGAMSPLGAWAPLSAWHTLQDDFQLWQFIPLSLVEDRLLLVESHRIAEKWVQDGMQVLKRKLEEPNVNTRLAVQRVLDKYGKGLGIEYQETKDLWTRYNVQEAKELEPLKQSFVTYADMINQIEGRLAQKNENFLRESDFWKIFFEGGESFATSAKYQVKPWPPVITIQPQVAQNLRLMGDPAKFPDVASRRMAEDVLRTEPGKPVQHNLFNYSERPFLFWRTAEEPPFVPEKLDQVRKQVVEAWKLNKARENILLPRAKKIAEAAAKSTIPSLTLAASLEELKKEYPAKGEIVPLGSFNEPISPLVPQVVGNQAQRIYADFELPKGFFTYPSKEMAAQLLNLYDLKKPFETGYKPLDDINDALYKEVAKEKQPKGKYVQILTNKPRTTFWIATITGPPDISDADFVMATQGAFQRDLLYDRGRTEAADHFREELIKQLRNARHAEATPKAHEAFDNDPAAGG